MSGIWGNLEVHVQPLYNIKEQKVVGAEALVRSKNKQVGAFEILEAIKRQGRLIEFDVMMIEKLCQCISYLNGNNAELRGMIPKNSGIKTGKLNINLSPDTLCEHGISKKILSIIDRYNARDRIVLELNEDSLFDNKAVERNIKEFTSSGIILSLDDFNMTNRGLRALSQFDVGEVKFKQTGLGEFTRKDIIILKYLKDMCGELKLNIIIEGIETSTQLGVIEELGIETVQGFIISKPIALKHYTSAQIFALENYT